MAFVFLLLAVGVAMRWLSEFRRRDPERRSWLFEIPESLADSLTTVVIYVSLPALILHRIPGLTMTTDLFAPIVIPWIMLAFSAVAVYLLSRYRGWGRGTTALLLLLVPLGNTSFLGIPMVEAFFGQEGVQFALLYDQFGSFLALATYGTIVVSTFSARKDVGAPGIGRILRGIIAFPPFVALLLALALRGVSLPEGVVSALSVLSATLVPLVMMAVGFKIRFRLPGDHIGPFTSGLAIKMGAAPLIALGVCRLWGLHGLSVDVAVFEAGMPPMIAAWALAMKAGFEPELGAAMVGYGILLSFITLSGLFTIL